jgi:hypothetical protein
MLEHEHVKGSTVEQMAVSNMELLRLNPYPGRGIVMGLDREGEQAIQVYWVMGRRYNSRNRVLVQEGDIVRTKPFDASKVEDPTLIIYTAMRVVGKSHLVSNGDQTDSVARVMENGGSFIEGLNQRTYEPDPPNFTPRITGECVLGSYLPLSFSILRRNPNGDLAPIHSYQSYLYKSGIGMCIHTYKGDGNPLPSFDGYPYPVVLNGSVDQIAHTYWDLLNAENRVALVAKGINLATGAVDYSIINQLK